MLGAKLGCINLQVRLGCWVTPPKGVFQDFFEHTVDPTHKLLVFLFTCNFMHWHLIVPLFFTRVGSIPIAMCHAITLPSTIPCKLQNFRALELSPSGWYLSVSQALIAYLPVCRFENEIQSQK